MALRFLKKDDVDRAVNEERGTAELVIVGVLIAIIDGIYGWLKGETLAAYGKNITELIVGGLVLWVVLSVYFEFRFRARETYGKVSAIEEAMTSSKEEHTQLLEKFAAIEGKLDSIQRELKNLIESAQ